MTAEDYYKLGNEYRRKGDWKHAIDNYLEAIALDPESPAVEAKQMLDDMFAFYCKDMYPLTLNNILLWEKSKVLSWLTPTDAKDALFVL